jgi:hypothetical protein
MPGARFTEPGFFLCFSILTNDRAADKTNRNVSAGTLRRKKSNAPFLANILFIFLDQLGEFTIS